MGIAFQKSFDLSEMEKADTQEFEDSEWIEVFEDSEVALEQVDRTIENAKEVDDEPIEAMPTCSELFLTFTKNYETIQASLSKFRDASWEADVEDHKLATDELDKLKYGMLDGSNWKEDFGDFSTMMEKTKLSVFKERGWITKVKQGRAKVLELNTKIKA